MTIDNGTYPNLNADRSILHHVCLCELKNQMVVFMRKGFENALVDIKNAFLYLKDFGFICSGETLSGNRVSVGYKGALYHIHFSYEFIEENFDFVLIKPSNPACYKPFWQIISELNPGFDYNKIKPNLNEYKPQLVHYAHIINEWMPIILDRKVLN